MLLSAKFDPLSCFLRIFLSPLGKWHVLLGERVGDWRELRGGGERGEGTGQGPIMKARLTGVCCQGLHALKILIYSEKMLSSFSVVGFLFKRLQY